MGVFYHITRIIAEKAWFLARKGYALTPPTAIDTTQTLASAQAAQACSAAGEQELHARGLACATCLQSPTGCTAPAALCATCHSCCECLACLAIRFASYYGCALSSSKQVRH